VLLVRLVVAVAIASGVSSCYSSCPATILLLQHYPVMRLDVSDVSEGEREKMTILAH
jgi:hypothetical protein